MRNPSVEVAWETGDNGKEDKEIYRESTMCGEIKGDVSSFVYRFHDMI